MQETTALVKVRPEADEAVVALYKQAKRLLLYAEALTIVHEDDVRRATNDLSIISGIKKSVEEKRKGYTQPITDHLKAVNEAFKVFTEPLLRADRITRDKVLEYRQEQERKRQKQENINRLRMEAAEKEMELKGEITESVDLVEVAPEVPKNISAEMGTAGERANWKYEVTDFALLPDAYKVADSSMLNAVAKKHHDQKQIPGVRFYNEPILAVRARKELID